MPAIRVHLFLVLTAIASLSLVFANDVSPISRRRQTRADWSLSDTLDNYADSQRSRRLKAEADSLNITCPDGTTNITFVTSLPLKHTDVRKSPSDERQLNRFRDNLNEANSAYRTRIGEYEALLAELRASVQQLLSSGTSDELEATITSQLNALRSQSQPITTQALIAVLNDAIRSERGRHPRLVCYLRLRVAETYNEVFKQYVFATTLLRRIIIGSNVAALVSLALNVNSAISADRIRISEEAIANLRPLLSCASSGELSGRSSQVSAALLLVAIENQLRHYTVGLYFNRIFLRSTYDSLHAEPLVISSQQALNAIYLQITTSGLLPSATRSAVFDWIYQNLLALHCLLNLAINSFEFAATTASPEVVADINALNAQLALLKSETDSSLRMYFGQRFRNVDGLATRFIIH